MLEISKEMKQLVVKADERAIAAKAEKLAVTVEEERDWFREQVLVLDRQSKDQQRALT